MGLDSIDDTPPAQILEDGQQSDDVLARRLDLERHGEEIKDKQQDRELRKRYATRLRACLQSKLFESPCHGSPE